MNSHSAQIAQAANPTDGTSRRGGKCDMKARSGNTAAKMGEQRAHGQ